MSLIKVQNVSKIFHHKKSHTLLRERLREIFKGPREGGFYALKNVSFDVQKEESVALIGANGAGKSTMLSVVCGLAKPDEGSVEVNGSIAPLLELGSGFHPDLKGRENVFMNAALLGLRKSQVRERYQKIVDFAELGEFMEDSLRTYSTGMVMRLAFSVAVHSDPAIVVIDEVLGVGDAAFQQKCFDKILDMRASGKTLLCVSHGGMTVKELCDRAIWLHHGEVIMDGPAVETVDTYMHFMANPGTPLPRQKSPKPVSAGGRKKTPK
jgi:ABC-type polysaccharide/polyol phosphate transport system ATPase subunit